MSSRLDESRAALLVPGSIWRHYKGGYYQLICAGLWEDDLTPAVAYRSMIDGGTWFRTTENFCEESSPGINRFELVAAKP